MSSFLRPAITSLTWVFVVLFGLTEIARAAVPRPDAPAAILLVTADQHSAEQRIAQLVARIDALQATHPGVPMAMLINGDAFEHGNPVARRSAGEIDFALMAALATRLPTVLNIGNHEAEFADLPATVTRLRDAGVTVISNLRASADGELFAPTTTTLRLGGRTLVIAGLATDDLPTYPSAIRSTLTAPAPVAWARQNLPAFFADADQPVLLSHAGIAADRAILPLVPDGTLFAGAHNHLRFVHPHGRTLYFHSGYWNEYLTVARLDRDEEGAFHWSVEIQPILDTDPADPALADLIARTRAAHLTPEDRTVVGRTHEALDTATAAQLAIHAVRHATRADAVFIGNTTFGAGLPAGEITREAFDAWVRFDGDLCVTEVDGARLARLLAGANQNPSTPFEARHGEFLYATGPTTIDTTKTYRIVTNDWGARNTARYFGEPTLTWTTLPDLRLKAAARQAIGSP